MLDFGSFGSAKAIPQMCDTHQVVKQRDLSDTKTKLLAIVANERGAAEALSYDQISYIGYPFSISENFQMRNTNNTIEGSLVLLNRLVKHVNSANRELVV